MAAPPPEMPRCDACRRPFRPDAHPRCYESPYLMLHVCPDCIEDYIRRHGAPCIHCGDPVLPHSQVAVYPDTEGGARFGHTTVTCNPAGNSFYGYWGRGRLESVFRCIEAC